MSFQQLKLLFSIALLCSSCGYRWSPEYPDHERPSIAVPFIPDDEDGSLTRSIIYALSSSGIADVRSDGELRLEAKILNRGSETIGFRRDQQVIKGSIRKNLLACEARKIMAVEVTLYKNDKVVYGPYKISAEVDYDYVDGDSVQDLSFTAPDGVFTTVLPFSLGQLESMESAQEAASRPVHAKLSQKIVDVISSEW
jgi:hypothetical protein